MSAYCGAKEVPKGRVRGTARECQEKSQIRFYGLESVPKEYTEKRITRSNITMSLINQRAEELKLKRANENIEYYTNMMNTHDPGTKKYEFGKEQLTKVEKTVPKIKKNLEEAIKKKKEIQAKYDAQPE